MALCPIAPVLAQDDLARCDTLLQTVVDLRKSNQATERDILEARLEAATDALSCFNGRKGLDWLTWLMRQQIVALDGLQRYDEAQDIVDAFFSAYTHEADSAAVARFYMWDLRFKYFDGNFSEALKSYEEGLPYAPKLPSERYMRYLLNGGSVHAAEGQFKVSLNIYGEAHQSFTSIPSPSEIGLFEVYGRATLGEAEASLDLRLYSEDEGLPLDSVINQLSRATAVFTLAESHERHAAAQSALALAYTLAGETERAEPHLLMARTIADSRGLHREQILTSYRRALMAFLGKDYAATLAGIEEALTLSDRYGIEEFTTRLHLLQGQAHEKAGRMVEAETAYQHAFSLAKDSSRGRDRDLIALAGESAFRVGDLKPKESPFPFLTYLFGFLGFLIVALLAYFVVMNPRRRRREAQQVEDTRHDGPDEEPPAAEAAEPHAEPAAPPAASQARQEPPEIPVVPAVSPAPAVPEGEPGPILGITDDDLTHERLFKMLRILFEPEKVTLEIDDPLLRQKLQRGLQVSNDIFHAVEELEGGEFDSLPGKSVGGHLRQQFKLRHIPWPQTPEAWRRLLNPYVGLLSRSM